MVKIDLAELVDICVGPMTPEEAGKEIIHYIHYKQPEKLIITMEKQGNKYYSSLYLTKEDFKKPTTL